MPRPVKITADSPCDIGPMLKERYDVELVPLHVTMNDTEYLDGVNITNDMIYGNWEKTGSLPKTSAVSVGDYEDVFQRLVDQGFDVVHISLGSGLSVTHQNAVMAAEEVSGVYVIDSCSLSTGIGLLVCEAGERVKQGLDAKTIYEEIKALNQKNSASFVLDTLDFLHAGSTPHIPCQIRRQTLRIRLRQPAFLQHPEDFIPPGGVFPPIPGEQVQPILDQLRYCKRAGKQI